MSTEKLSKNINRVPGWANEAGILDGILGDMFLSSFIFVDSYTRC